MKTQASPDLTLFQRLIPLVKTLQFAWFVGHLCLILCVLRYTFSWTRMKSDDGMAQFCYRTALISAATTYGIAIYKILRFRTPTSPKRLRGALSIAFHETVQYLTLALIWLFMPQRLLALLPYCIYSIFHVAVYIRSHLIPIIQTEIETNVVTPFQSKLQTNLNALQTNVVSTIQTEIETSVVTPLQTKLQTNINPLQTAHQTNLNLEVRATLKTMTVAFAAGTPDAEAMLASGSLANKISVFMKTHYDRSVSVLAQVIISLFIPQWIYPIFYLVTRLPTLPTSTSGAKPHVVSTPNSIADNIDIFIRTYYDISMALVTRVEVFIWFNLLFSAIAFQRRSWIMIVLYTVFLRARYNLSELAQLEAKVDAFLVARNIPFTVRWAWKSAMKLSHWFYYMSDLSKYTGADSAPKED